MSGTLSATGKRIAEYILAHPNDVVHMSVTEVAEAAQASEGSVVRLCHMIETKGFQDLKLALTRELVQPIQFIHEDLQPDDTVSSVIEKVFQSGMQALADTLKVLNSDAMQKAVQIILEADRVEFYGIGSASPVAVDAYYRMLRIGINCVVVTDSHIQAVSASLTSPKVAVLTISHSGSTRETVAAMRLAHEAGTKTICITNYGKSPIQSYADVVLYTAARETQFRTEAMTQPNCGTGNCGCAQCLCRARPVRTQFGHFTNCPTRVQCRPTSAAISRRLRPLCRSCWTSSRSAALSG
jgi:DNA-binding MurR/RpiR family transcriptional regulator